MNNQLLDEVTNEYLKEREPFKVGDGVNVHVRVREGEKERIQIFEELSSLERDLVSTKPLRFDASHLELESKEFSPFILR